MGGFSVSSVGFQNRPYLYAAVNKPPELPIRLQLLVMQFVGGSESFGQDSSVRCARDELLSKHHKCRISNSQMRPHARTKR